MKRLADREFAYPIAVATVEPEWTSADVAADEPVPADAPYRGFVRFGHGSAARFAYFGGRQHWLRGTAPVSAGLLFAVSPDQRFAPRRLPSDSARFREIAEASMTTAVGLLDELLQAYR